MLLVDMGAAWPPTMAIMWCLLESFFLILEPVG